MKNYILLFAFIFTALSIYSAVERHCEGEEVLLIIPEVDDTGMPTHPRTPVRPPVVYHNENILCLHEVYEQAIVELRDEAGNIAFSILIVPATERIIIPGDLDGTFELRIICENVTFQGFIVL